MSTWIGKYKFWLCLFCVHFEDLPYQYKNNTEPERGGTGVSRVSGSGEENRAFQAADGSTPWTAARPPLLLLPEPALRPPTGFSWLNKYQQPAAH